MLQLHKWIVANVQGSTIYSDTAAANYEKAGLTGVFESQIPNIPAKRLGTTEEVCFDTLHTFNVFFMPRPCSHPCVCDTKNSTTSGKLLERISRNLQFRCSLGQRWTGYILRSKGQWSRSQREQMNFSGKGILEWLFVVENHLVLTKKYVLWNVCLPNVVAFHTLLSKYLTVIVMTLN